MGGVLGGAGGAGGGGGCAVAAGVELSRQLSGLCADCAQCVFESGAAGHGADRAVRAVLRYAQLLDGQQFLCSDWVMQNVYAENGALNNFVNWSAPSQPALQQCPLSSGSTYIPSGIGPFNSTFPAQKNLQFSASQGVTQLLVKVGVAVSDSRLLDNRTNVSQTVQEYEQNGTIFIVTTSSLGANNLSTTMIPFLTLTLSNLLANNALILNTATAYQNASLVTSKCGSIYQYQFTVAAAAGTIFQQLSLQLALPAGAPTLWWLMDFRVEAGCSGFAVGASCSTCLTGFYPQLTFDGYPNGCPHCPYACATCATAGCLTCEPYATYNATSYSCYYPLSYAVYNSTQGYSQVVGSVLNGSNSSSSMFTQVYQSQNRLLSFNMQLNNNQSYFAKMYLLFPQSYIQNNVNFNISIDGTSWTAANLNNNLATLSTINNAQGLLYVLPFRIDRMGANNCYSNGQMTIQLNTNAVTDEFYLADFTIVQYQCSKNCLQCSFNLAQTTPCSLCGPFYQLTTNCLTCANGFFEIANATSNRCVKCYSNCKQCLGPSNYQCTQCFPKFSLTDYGFNTTCIMTALGRNPNPECRLGPTIDQLKAQTDCAACLTKNQVPNVYNDPNCISCWMSYNYAWGRCGPSPNSALSFYASDATLGQNSTKWTGSGLTTQGCTSDYPALQGIANLPNNTNHTTPVPSRLDFALSSMPPHLGLSFVMTLLKVDYWAVTTDPNNRASLMPLALTVVLESPNSPAHTFTLPLSNSFGANICQQSSNQMIWTFQGFISDHAAASTNISVLSPDKGIFVRQLQVYLANCPSCSNVQLAFALTLLPAYSDNSSQTGLDTYVTFNNPVNYTNGGSPDALANSYAFSVNGDRVSNAVLTENRLDNPDYNYLKYFLPLNNSYTNATVTASTTQAGTIFTQNAGTARQLAQSYQTAALQRYQNTSPDVRLSVSQLSQFFNFFQWFTIITMIVAAGLGVGVVFEQFSMMMQLIYYHIYITSWLLPSSAKIPLAHGTRLEHLNYFGNINSIQTNLFGNGPLIPSNYIFTQYNVDIYFLRSIYPVLIINAIFIGWFLLLKVLELTVAPFRNSPNRFVRFLRSIPSRPLAYFDQLWRYQYLTVMWACMMQFTNFTGDGSLKVNLACCVLAFIIDILWPIFTTIYTYRLHFTTNVKHFLYLYHDLYYLKTPSLCDQPKSYLYSVLRAIRLLAYAVFIALFVNQSVIGPVLLIFFNLVDAAVAYFLNIYRTSAYLLTRLLENALLIVAAILCLVFYGFADSNSFDQDSYQNLGFGLSTVFVLMVINGLVRVIYLIYKKVEEWSMGTYDVGERGELENFDDKSPVKLAQQSERIDIY